MSLVVGLARDGRGTSALHLAAVLARSRSDRLVVCAVVSERWPAGIARIDAEYQDYVENAAGDALDLARLALPSDIEASFELVRAHSTPAGLLTAADQHGANMLVIGSTSSGAHGQVSLGSVAERLLHSAPVPVAMAPRGFRARPTATVHRVTAAYGATGGSDEVVGAAAELAVDCDATLRVASFAVRPPSMLTAGVGSRADDAVLTEWGGYVEAQQAELLTKLGSGHAVRGSTESAIGYGRDWRDAIDHIGWTEGDLLLVGSSSVGPLARVFLGSRASKIVRNSPLPVVVLPRTGQQ
ncbi:MAG TPA: universal stress protein [Pseudonocardia sp.]|nr:universal stress protein [Pseudonocardia sp.]